MGTRARIVSQLLSSANVGAGGNLNISDVLPLLTTANVVETSNLYYTNLRVYANLELASIAVLQDVDDNVLLANVGDVLIFDGNVWYAGLLDTNVAQFAENANVANTVATISNFTTDDLTEGSNNLYFTNVLSRFAISAGNPTIIYNPFTGEISANLTAVAASANTTDTLPEGFVNRYFTNARVVSNVQTLSINTFADVNVDGVTNGKVLVYDANLLAWVPGDEVFKSIIAEEANTVLQINNFTTDDLTEGANNLYYTNVRVEDAVVRAVANLSINDIGDVNTEVNLQVESLLSWDGTKWVPRSLDNVTASVNAEFAERSNIANLALVSLYTDFSETSNVANTALYALVANIATSATNAAFAQLAAYANNAGNATYAEFANVSLNNLSLDAFTTDDLVEGSNNLYYTDARVFANISQTSINIHNDVDINYANASSGDVLTWSGSQWIASNVIAEARAADFAERSNVANTVLTLSNFTTDDLTEGINNLYYEAARVDDDIYDILRSKDFIEVQNLRATGNLDVQGQYAKFDVDEFTTQSKTIVIANGAGSAEGAGLFFAAGANASITYSTLDDRIGIDKNLVLHGNLLPAISGEFNIGDQNRFWKGIYIGGRTIFLGNLTLSEKPGGGGLAIRNTLTGELAEIDLANVVSTEFVSVDRVIGNTEIVSYIGGNTQQWLQGETGNLYMGVLKHGNIQQFGGMRIVERRTGEFANAYSVQSLSIDNPGNGYLEGNVEVVILGGSGGRGATANIELDANGSIQTITLLSRGEYYETVPNVVIYRNDLANVGIFEDAIITTTLDLGNVQSKPRIQSDVIFYNDKEGENLSIARLGLLGDGAIQITGNVSVNGKPLANVIQETISNTNPVISTYSNTYSTLEYDQNTGVITVNKDGVYEATAILTLSPDWQDTPIKAAFIPTGTYVVQIKANDSSVGGGHTNEYYSGVMSWYSDDTNSVVFDEIVMHRAGAGVGSGTIFLRVIRTETADSDDLKLQISGTANNTGVSSYNFKFRRLL